MDKHAVGVTGRLWKKVSDSEKATFKKMASEGFSFRDIARKFGRDHHVVSYALKGEQDLLAAASKRKAQRLLRKKTKPKAHVELMRKLGSCAQQARTRAERKGLAIDIDTKLLMDLFTRQGGACALTGIALETTNRPGQRCNPYAVSLDRIDSRMGYTSGNVRLVVWCMNWMLGEWGESHFEEMAKAFFIKKYGTSSGLVSP